MSIKTKAGQIWTDSVAYVALGLGAATSMAGNAANVLRVRGDATDGLDLFLAVFFPGLVVLMVEVFVSSRWRGLHWSMQVLRWLGCAAVTAVAMRVSWVHLHALMLSRGQEADVAILGPLAIDFLAIMATALILAGRGRSVPAASVSRTTAPAGRHNFLDTLAAADSGQEPTLPVQDMPAPVRVDMPVATQADADESADIMANPSAYLDVSRTTVADEARTWLDTLAAADGGQEPTLPVPVSPAPASRAKLDTIPDTAKELYLAWTRADESERPRVGQADMLVAAEHGVSTRTARGWRAALLVS